MMFGPDMLVAPVFEPGQRQRCVYLPRGPHGLVRLLDGGSPRAGATITVDAPLERMPLFVPAGRWCPLTDSTTTRGCTEEPSRQLRWFPGATGTSACALYEDDGLRPAAADDRHVVHRFAAQAHAARLNLALASSGTWGLPYRQIRVVLPAGETRKLELASTGGAVLVA